MKKRKALGLLLSLSLMISAALPGTLAVSADVDSTDITLISETVETKQSAETTSSEEEYKTESTAAVSEVVTSEEENDVPACSCGTTNDTHEEGCPLYVKPGESQTPAEAETPSCSCGSEDGTHEEGCPLYEKSQEPENTEDSEDSENTEKPQTPESFQKPEKLQTPETKTCTCGSENDVHAEDCPLYEKTDEAEPVCTCGSENDVHQKDCPLYKESDEADLPERRDHIDTCLEDCDGEDCECPCHHKSALFERLMACTTLEELFAIVDETSEEELQALTDEENRQIEELIEKLEPEPLPAIVIEQSEDEPVISEIIYPTVNFDNVAPFGDPVVG